MMSRGKRTTIRRHRIEDGRWSDGIITQRDPTKFPSRTSECLRTAVVNSMHGISSGRRRALFVLQASNDQQSAIWTLLLLETVTVLRE